MCIKPKMTGYPSLDKVHLADIPEEKLHPDIPTMSLLAAFQAINASTMDSPDILIERDGFGLTKRGFLTIVWESVQALISWGLRPGETIVIYTPNRILSIVLTFAANAIGIKVAIANYGKPIEDALAIVDDHRASALVVWDMLAPEVKTIFSRAKSLRVVTSTGNWFIVAYAKPGVKKLPVDPQAVDQLIASHANDNDECIFLQTSGSTANAPKILPFTNRNVMAALRYMTDGTNQTTNDQVLKKGLCVLAFNHPYGWMMIMANLIGGNHIELASGYSAAEIGHWHEKRPNFIYGTPQFLREFIDQTPKDADLSFLKAFFSAGLKTDEALYDEAIRFFRAHGSDAEVRNNYGTGETLCIGTTTDGVPHRPDTSGKPYPGLTLRIVDENMQEVKYDEPGELLIRSESMITHYFHNDAETAKSFVEYNGELFFRPGDIASLSRDNYLTLHGRKKRFYQPRGANDKVNCETIETALAKIDCVSENAVTIYRLPDGSDSGAAFVVLKTGTSPTDQIREKIFVSLNQTLRSFELPTKLVFVSELPLLASGKTDYVKLTERANRE